jgi:hypothetical protein
MLDPAIFFGVRDNDTATVATDNSATAIRRARRSFLKPPPYLSLFLSWY